MELRDVPEPRIQPEQVKIAVRAAAICGTDVHIYHDRFRNRPPVVLGHEYAGEVVEVGPAVVTLKVGDKVVAGNPARTCGRCFHCQVGNPYLCSQYLGRGYFLDGGFAEYVGVEESCCHRVPEGVCLEHASLCEPLAGVLRGMTERVSIKPGECVVVFGAGCIGILAAMVAKLQGARAVIAGLTKDAHRLAVARAMGVDWTLDVERDDLMSAVQKLADKDGADIVVECSGSKAAFEAALEVVRKGGVVLQLGIFPGPFEATWNHVVMKELAVVGSYGQSWQCWETALALLRDRRIDMRPLIDEVLPLAEWRKGMELTESCKAVRVVLKP